ncbi:MAG TPA: serine protease [Gemmatimonadaceae bacterium]
MAGNPFATFHLRITNMLKIHRLLTTLSLTLALTASGQSQEGSRPYRETVNRFLNHEDPKIVGGIPAPTGAYPWQVSLGVSWIADPYRAHFCGGSVISASWIVTAAHCLENTSTKDVIVTAGTHLLGSETGGARRNVKRIIVKSNFDPQTMNNDVALIELLEPLELDPAIQPIRLLSSAEEGGLLQKGTQLTVTGWGTTRQNGKPVRDLRYVEVPLVERATCNRPLAYDSQISVNMICAGVAAGGVDACQGDSGGPLTVGAATTPELAGIVSWGEGCARPNKPGVYTRVSSYSRWVAGCVARPESCR